MYTEPTILVTPRPFTLQLDLMLNTINDIDMQYTTISFPKHACQHCGAQRKLVETLIDDEFFWNEDEKRYEPNNFTDSFEHTGSERCAECRHEWTGI